MNETNTLLILTLCGLGVVCAGTFLILGFFAFRIGLTGVLAIFGVVRDEVSGEAASESLKPVTPVTGRTNLRARAEQVDFDEALARRQGGGSPLPPPLSPDAPSPPLGSRRESPPRPDRRMDNDDDLYGGLLAEDDDSLF